MNTNTIEMIPSEKTFIEWASMDYSTLRLTEEEAGLVLSLVLGHGCGIGLNATDTIICLDLEEPENGIIATGFDELMDRVSTWQYEFLDDTEVRGAYREQMTKDIEVIDGILERMGWREGRHLGTPTVKQMIKILSKLPEDYRITCCGAENYLYVFASSKCITIDNEQYLDC